MTSRCPHCGRHLGDSESCEVPSWFAVHPADETSAVTGERSNLKRWGEEYFERRFSEPDPYSFAESSFERRKYERQISHVEKLLPAPDKILELGCAEGVHTELLAAAFPEAEIVGIDISETAVERARRRVHADRVRFEQGDVLELADLVKGSFDLVVCSELIYYLGDRFTTRELFGCLQHVCSFLADDGVLSMAQVVVEGTGPPPRLAAKPLIDSYHQLLSGIVTPVVRETYRDKKASSDREYTYKVWTFRR